MTRDRARVRGARQPARDDRNSVFGDSEYVRVGSGGRAQWRLASSCHSGGTRRGNARARLGASRPSIWPLSERGFVTQELYDGGTGDHPGLDIAVPSDSYIRAAGGGTVVDVGEDVVYGRFVVIDHGEATASLYGHASTTFVRLGQSVRERQVIALSGSTGRSTAPHLHFEVLVNGEPADPLTFVEQPG